VTSAGAASGAAIEDAVSKPGLPPGSRFRGAAWTVSLATLLSRLLGLLREQLFAALLGASSLADAFVSAFRIPNLLRDLLAEGALSGALVPAFKARLARGGAAAAHRLAAGVAGNLAVGIGGLVLLATWLTPSIVDGLAGDYARIPGKFETTVLLTRVMLPFLVLVSLSAVAMSLQNAHDQFLAPALAPAMFNIIAIGVGVTLYFAGARGRWVAIGWALGTVLGGVAQLLLQLPGLWRHGWRPRLWLDLRLRDPAIRAIALALAPAILGVAAVQLNVFVNTMFASSEPGAVAWLNYAFRFLQLPVGVFGIAIATVSTARYADAAITRDSEAIGRCVVEGLRMVLLLCGPATVGLLVLDEAILRLLYQRGRFASRDTVAAAAALECYAAGMVAYAGVKVVAPAFYALGRVRAAVAASLVSVLANLGLNAALHSRWGYRGLAAGTAVAALLNGAALYVAFSRSISPLPHRTLLRFAAKIVLSCSIMAVCVREVHRWIDARVGHFHTRERLIETLLPVGVGAVVYLVACFALRIEEVRDGGRRLLRHWPWRRLTR
jgi:putative peptidoglycan lipid II flippase